MTELTGKGGIGSSKHDDTLEVGSFGHVNLIPGLSIKHKHTHVYHNCQHIQVPRNIFGFWWFFLLGEAHQKPR